MMPSDENIRAAIAQQAAEWFIANQSSSLAEEDGAAFLSWLQASPVHVREYLAVARIAHHFPAAIGEPRVPLETFLAQATAGADDRVVSLQKPALQQKPSEEARRDNDDTVVELGALSRRVATLATHSRARPTWRLATAAILAMLVVTASLLWWSRDGERFGLPRTYQTGHGEQGAWRLPDGSMLHLNTESIATVRYSSAERVVDVARGEALFEVSHADGRRFRVSAGDAQVLAVGTEFDVYRRRDTTLVTVIEGTVEVSAGEPPPLPGGGTPPAPSQPVTAGQQIGVESGKLWAAPKPVDARAAIAWLHHQIIVQDRPLGEVVDEFNRYAHVTVEIDDAHLRELRVSGRFDAYDTESFAAFLASLDGVTVEKTASRIRALRLPGTKSEPPPAGD